MEVNIKDLYNIYDLEIRKNVKNKKALFKFEMYKSIFINDIYNTLIQDNYKGSKYNIFLIKDPKYRIVMSESIYDKIINHYFTRNVLMKKLNKYLDIRNVATRENMGTKRAYELVNKYIEKHKKYDKFYILKLDISKYFYNIDHNIILKDLSNKLNKSELLLLKSILNNTNKEYVNKSILYYKSINNSSEVQKIPLYKKNKGLPLGSLSSQFLAIYYLSSLDHYIVNNLKLKYMVRYMDDYIIFSEDKKKLLNAYEVLLNKINDYNLKLNINKCHITSSKEGFVFLGYKYKIINKKTIRKLYSRSKIRIFRRIKKVNKDFYNGNISFERYFYSINNYLCSYKYSKKYIEKYIKKNINIKNFKYNRRYNFIKNIYKKHVIIFYKKGNLYSYNDDKYLINKEVSKIYIDGLKLIFYNSDNNYFNVLKNNYINYFLNFFKFN